MYGGTDGTGGLGTKHLEVDDFSSKFPTKNSYAN